MTALRITPAFQSYCQTYQPGFLSPANLPSAPQDARTLALILKSRVGDVAYNHFWAIVPDDTTPAQDATYCAAFIDLLDAQGDLDKTLAIFRAIVKGE